MHDLTEQLAEQIRLLNAPCDVAWEFDGQGCFPMHWSLGALSMKLPPAPFESTASTRPALATYPLKHWYRLSYYFAMGAMNDEESPLRQKASSEHVVAYSLLHDWWTARYQDPAIIHSASGALIYIWPYNDVKDKAGRIASKITQDYLVLQSTPTYGVPKTAAQYAEPGTVGIPGTYVRQMWDLFDSEFRMAGGYCPHQEEELEREKRLSRRKIGIVRAYVQYLSWAVFEQSSPPKADLPGNIANLANVLAGEAEKKKRHVLKSYGKWMGRSIFGKALGHYHKDSTAEPDSATSSGARQSNTGDANISLICRNNAAQFGATTCDQHLVSKYGQVDITTRGPILKSCPWSTTGQVMDEHYDFPRYLWDREQGRTVVVSSLIKSSSLPSYIAVSHTWGRWPKAKPIAISGVPWLVPQNSKFEVKDIHSILRAIPSKIKYVWMDLVCIPQDQSKEGAMEISRQAKIFRNAEKAMAWFSDVESFDCLGSILSWWTLEFLQVYGKEQDENRIATKEKAWAAIHGKQSGLMEPCSKESTLEVGRSLHPWFTSLWTLQEVCLRPDMLLCACDWRPLSCSGSNPIPLSGLLAVLETRNPAIAQRVYDPGHSKVPVSIDELELWLVRSELHKLLNLDRAAILTLANRRQCKERRAEAIMSALGTVEWYNKALSDHGPEKLNEVLEQDLVLGKYPLAFLNELANEAPADFFGAYRRIDVTVARRGAYTLPKEGSMMPFGRPEANFADVRGLSRGSLGKSIMTHESLHTWRVEQSGAAKLPRVCLVSSKEIAAEAVKIKKILPGKIIAHTRKPSQLCVLPSEIRAKLTSMGYTSAVDETHDDGYFDLHTWISESPREVYAILTRYIEIGLKGVEWLVRAGSINILERVDGKLVKAGDVLITDTELNLDLDNNRTVDWVVA